MVLGQEPGTRLECCSICHWGWVCGEHRAEYMTPQQHGKVCATYASMNSAQLKMAKILTDSGE